MELIDPSTGKMRCKVCGSEHNASIKPNSGGIYYRGSWQCVNKCKLDWMKARLIAGFFCILKGSIMQWESCWMSWSGIHSEKLFILVLILIPVSLLLYLVVTFLVIRGSLYSQCFTSFADYRKIIFTGQLQREGGPIFDKDYSVKFFPIFFVNYFATILL